MQQLNAAYGMVRDPDRRRQYDLECRARRRRERLWESHARHTPRRQPDSVGASEVPAPQPEFSGRHSLIRKMLKTAGAVLVTLAVAFGGYLWQKDQVAT